MRIFSIGRFGAAPLRACQSMFVLRGSAGRCKRDGAMRVGLLMLFIAGLAPLPVVQADTAPLAQAEIEYLLGFVGKSGCEFFRNGTWYKSQSAEAHLRSKYKAVVARWPIDTAE